MTAPASVGRMQPLRHLDGPPIAKKVGEINDDHQEWLDAQPVRTGCGLCEWAFEGTAVEGRVAAREHRETVHPEVVAALGRRGRKRPALPKGVIPMVPQKDPEAKADGEARAATLSALHERRATEDGLEEAGDARVAAHADASPSSSNPYGLTRSKRGYAWTRETAIRAVQDFALEHGRPPAQRDCVGATGRLPSDSTLARMFGSHAAAIEAAGYERPTRATKYRKDASRPTRDEQEPNAALTAPVPTSPLPGEEPASLERAQATDPPAATAPAAFQAGQLTHELTELAHARRRPSRPDRRDRVTERELQFAVIECAQLLGYRVAHFRPAQTSKGWRTPVEADGAGWPDLVLVRGPRLIFAELKSATGKLSPAQEEWKDTLERAGQTVYVWRPADWLHGAVEAVLRAGDLAATG